MPDAWDLSKGDPNIIIAVIDGGVEYTLEEFNINNSLFEIYYYGNPKKLRSEFSKFGYMLMNNQGVWHLILNE